MDIHVQEEVDIWLIQNIRRIKGTGGIKGTQLSLGRNLRDVYL